MKCINCSIKDSEKYSKYSNGKFCSRECARSYSTKNKRSDINERVSEKLKGRESPFKGKKRPKRSIKKIVGKWKRHKQKILEEKLLASNFDELKFEKRKKRILIEQKYKCNKCGLVKWKGKKITLELEHIDGETKNNSRSNLECLCPNCHALTSTWRGRNKVRKGKMKVPNEILLKSLIVNKFNIRKSLLEVGLVAKGGNYARAHKLIKEYKIVST